jgi:hypothetical protein
MAFDLRGMLTAVQAIVNTLPTIHSTTAAVYMGVPESFAARVNAYIVLGRATPVDNVWGGEEWEPEVTVAFGYRVSANESTAELIISDLILELVTAVLVTNPTLSGTCDSGRVRIDTNAAANPEYRAVAGSEARLYPVTITGYQQRTVT